MSANFGDLSSAKGLGELNKHLADRSYVDGYTPSAADVTTFDAITSAPDSKNPHVARWYKHIRSFSDSERKSWGGASTGGEAAPAAASKKEEDDFDLFGEEDEAAEKAREDALEQRAQEQLAKKEADRIASGKAKVIMKSAVVIDVKPWEAETDLAKMEELVRTVTMEGLDWKAAKLVAIGYGVKKLQISCHIVDDLVSVDDIQEQIQAFEDYVQSTDIVTFTKL